MKKVIRYDKLTKELIDRLNAESFKFLKFHEGIKNIEIITVENDGHILAYSILEHANYMNSDFYYNLVDSLVDDIEAITDEIDNIHESARLGCLDSELLEIDKSKLKVLEKGLELLTSNDFYYISYMECIPVREGNGRLLVEYIKEHYKNTILIASGYTSSTKDCSTDFWIKNGYEHSGVMMMSSMQ